MSDATERPVIYIEVEQTSGAVRPEMSADKFVEGTRETLDHISAVVEESCSAFISRISALETKPTELSIEFGVNAAAEGGVPFVTKGSIGANFKISLTWSWTK